MLALSPRTFNQFEVVLWAILGVIFAFRGLMDSRGRLHAVTTAVVASMVAAGMERRMPADVRRRLVDMAAAG